MILTLVKFLAQNLLKFIQNLFTKNLFFENSLDVKEFSKIF